MSDTTNNSVTPNPSEDLGNPQSLVDAALSPAPVAPVVTEPLPPIVPPAFVAPTQPEPSTTSAPATPTVSMGDDTPLAFVTSAPVTPASVTNTEQPPVIPLAPSAPLPKPKSKMGTLIAGLLLVVGMIGGVFSYNYIINSNDVAILTDGETGYLGGKTVKPSSAGRTLNKPGDETGTTTGTIGTGVIVTDANGNLTVTNPNSNFDPSGLSEDFKDQVDKLNNDGKGRGTVVGESCDPSSSDGRGGCSEGQGCSCTDKVNFLNCKCGPTGGQDPCFHTICPVNYSCKKSGVDAYCAPNPRPSAPADESTPPQPSPSTVASMSCTGITSIPSINPAPIIGAKLVFTCDGTVTPSTAGTLSYKFRYSINNGAFTAMTNKTATTSELTIAACGSYKVQCQACATLNSVITCDPIWTGATQ